MFLSFVVPIYNVKDYIRECVDSLLNQNIDNFEIILIDDGSKDGSGEICDEYESQNRNIKVIHQINRGLSDARNAGIRAARGCYIAFIDGDDYIKDNCLNEIQHTVKNQNYPEVMFMRTYKKYADGKTRELDEVFDLNRINKRNRTEVLAYLSELKKYPGSACSKLVNREYLLTNNLFFKPGMQAEDLDWTKRVFLSAESFGYYSSDYYYYRQNRKGSITNTVSSKSYNDRILIFDNWIHEIKINHEKTEMDALKSFASYEYKIMLADANKLDNRHKEIAYKWLQENRILLNYRNDSQLKIIRNVAKLVGIKKTSKLLGVYMKLRNKK